MGRQRSRISPYEGKGKALSISISMAMTVTVTGTVKVPTVVYKSTVRVGIASYRK